MLVRLLVQALQTIQWVLVNDVPGKICASQTNILIVTCVYLIVMKLRIIIDILALAFLSSCNTNNKYPTEIEGYAPIYIKKSEQYSIDSKAAQPFENPGKIYRYGNTTFQMEIGKGIHVINMIDPKNPTKIKFIAVPGCTEISIKNNFLFTNNFEDLVTINIADLNSISEVARSKGVFPVGIDNQIPEQNAYFECIDPAKGVVIGWKKAILQNPKCRF